MKFLAIDPGQSSTGWAKFDDEGKPLGVGKVKGDINEFADWLESQEIPDTIIFENYRVNPAISHAFSKVRTVEVIGLIKRYAHVHRINLVEQRNVVLPIGLRYLGMYGVYYKGNKRIKHVDDEVSALAHGTYYLIKSGIVKHRMDKDAD